MVIQNTLSLKMQEKLLGVQVYQNAGHVYYTRRNKEIKTNGDKYKALFTHLVNMIINYYDKEAAEKAESKY